MVHEPTLPLLLLLTVHPRHLALRLERQLVRAASNVLGSRRKLYGQGSRYGSVDSGGRNRTRGVWRRGPEGVGE